MIHDVLPDAWPASTAYKRERPALFREVTRSSHYVTMRDGTRLAVDVHRPAEARVRLPTIVRQTRYFRGYDARVLGKLIGEATLDPINGRMRRAFVTRGYAWVDVDVRGSGASSGVWHSPWSPLEVADGAEVLDWIVAQPWSNGRVGATGNSYDGTAAELLAANGHPALRAIAPRCSLFDVYTDVAYPGGLRHAWFVEAWTRANQALDADRPEGMVGEAIAQGHPWWEGGLRRRALEAGLRLVFGPIRSVAGDRGAIERAMGERGANLDVAAISRDVEFRDDVRDTVLGPQTIDAFSPSAYADRVRASGVPVLGIGAWLDSAYPHAAIKRHLTLGDARHRLVLGPWNHGITMNASPCAADRAAGFDLDAELLRFFDQHLLDLGAGTEPPVRYYVMGAEQWRTATSWPPPDSVPRRYYLDRDRALVDAAPSAAGQDPLDETPTATGRRSRWRTLVSPFVVPDYPDRISRERDMLVYRSAPLDAPLEIAGHPVVTLFVRADATDGALFAYLEEEAANGTVRYITEGQLRLVHRELDGATPYFISPTPHHAFTRPASRPLVPGEVAAVTFDLLPTAYRFASESRIRLALATGDADHFDPVPGGARRYVIERGGGFASRLQLPVRA